MTNHSKIGICRNCHYLAVLPNTPTLLGLYFTSVMALKLYPPAAATAMSLLSCRIRPSSCAPDEDDGILHSELLLGMTCQVVAVLPCEEGWVTSILQSYFKEAGGYVHTKRDASTDPPSSDLQT